MSDPASPPRPATWVGPSVLLLLGLQMGLLWIQGSLLQRQHEDLLGLREDVQALAESLEDSQGGWAGEAEGALRPVQGLRTRPARRARAVPAAFLQVQPDEDKTAAQEQEANRKSEREAVAKGREVNSKLSIAENIRKADEKARLDSENRRWRPWLWFAGGVAILAMLLRSWLRRRG